MLREVQLERRLTPEYDTDVRTYYSYVINVLISYILFVTSFSLQIGFTDSYINTTHIVSDEIIT